MSNTVVNNFHIDIHWRPQLEWNNCHYFFTSSFIQPIWFT